MTRARERAIEGWREKGVPMAEAVRLTRDMDASLMTTEQAMAVRVYAADGPLSQGLWILMGPRMDGCEGQAVLFGPDTLLACNQAREMLASVVT